MSERQISDGRVTVIEHPHIPAFYVQVDGFDMIMFGFEAGGVPTKMWAKAKAEQIAVELREILWKRLT